MHAIRVGGLGALLFIAGCSFIYDADRAQCDAKNPCKPTDESGAMLVCGAENLCETKACGGPSDCTGDSRCDPKINRCVAAVRCTQDSDCNPGVSGAAPNRCGFDGFCYEKWGCLDTPRDWPTPASMFSYKTLIRRTGAVETPSALPALRVTACNSADPDCGSPTVSPERVTVVEENKLFTVPFVGTRAPGFTGYIKFEEAVPAGTTPSLVTIYMLVTPETPLTADFFDPQILTLSPRALLDQLFMFVKGADPQGGMLGVFVYDCGGRPAPNVTMVHSGGGNALLVPVDSNASLLPGSNLTTDSGSAIMFNLPTDMTGVFILRDEVLQRTLTDQISVVIRKGVLSQFSYFPRYSAMQKASQHAASQLQ